MGRQIPGLCALPSSRNPLLLKCFWGKIYLTKIKAICALFFLIFILFDSFIRGLNVCYFIVL